MGSNLVEGGVVRKCPVASKAADTHTCGGLGRSLQEREERSPQTGVSLHKGLWDAEVLVAQSCTTLCDPMDQPTRLCLWNSPGKNTGVVAISFSRDLPDPGFRLRSPALQADSFLSEPLGKLWDAVISNPLMTSGRAGQVDSLPLKDEGAENRGGENTEPHRCTSFLPFCLTSHITGCFLLLQRVSEC